MRKIEQSLDSVYQCLRNAQVCWPRTTASSLIVYTQALCLFCLEAIFFLHQRFCSSYYTEVSVCHVRYKINSQWLRSFSLYSTSILQAHLLIGKFRCCLHTTLLLSINKLNTLVWFCSLNVDYCSTLTKLLVVFY